MHAFSAFVGSNDFNLCFMLGEPILAAILEMFWEYSLQRTTCCLQHFLSLELFLMLSLAINIALLSTFIKLQTKLEISSSVFLLSAESLKVYYLHLKFVNPGSKVVVASWLDPEGKQKTVEVKPGYVEDTSVFTASYLPSSVEITAIDKETNNSVLLNDTQSLQISPKETAELATIYVREGIEH